jgi:hypothetical protein
VRANAAAGGLSLGRDLFSAFRATVGPADLGAARAPDWKSDSWDFGPV